MEEEEVEEEEDAKEEEGEDCMGRGNLKGSPCTARCRPVALKHNRLKHCQESSYKKDYVYISGNKIRNHKGPV